MIPESFIQELLNRVDIVEMINKVVPLKKTGKNYMACCPFHKEKTPSFSVNPQKQFFKCFGCGAAGSAIGFVMRYEGLTYPEAIRKLADSVGMVVPEEKGAAKREARARTLTDRMQQAADFYVEALKENTRAQDYLKTRGITGETAARFSLGYSPDAWQSLESVFGEHYKDPEMEETNGCGLVIVNENGRRYDRFRGRIMFPIRNRRGQVIGFGARTMTGDEHPKYLNSPETAIYHKGLEIYGLYEAADAVRTSGRAIVCEGYMDVIQLSQAGFREAVAALGTSITSDHVRKLLKTVDKIYFSFDGDSAGQHALRRAMEAALPAVGDAQEIRFVVLPPEHDPDSLIKALGASVYEDELKKSLTLSQFFVKSVMEGKDPATAEGRSQFLAEAKPLVLLMKNAPLLRGQLIGELAMYARMTPDELARAFGLAQAPLPARPAVPAFNRTPGFGFQKKPGFFRGSGYREAPRRITPVPGVADMREKLLQYFVSYPELAYEFGPRIAEEFVDAEDPVAQQIVEVWRAVQGDGDHPVDKPQVLLEMLAQSPNAPYYRELLAREMLIETPLVAARQEINVAMSRLELQRIERMLTDIAASPNPDLARYQALTARRMAIKAQIDEISQAFDRTAELATL